MKFIGSVLLTALLCFVFEQFFPWYSVAFASFLVGYLISQNGLVSFLSGSLGVGLLWLGMAWRIDVNTGSILSTKMAGIFNLNEPIYMIIITFLIGFFVGGLSAWAGHNLKKIFEKKRRTGYYL